MLEKDEIRGENHYLVNENLQNKVGDYIQVATVSRWIGIGGALILFAIALKVFFTPNTIDSLINFLNWLK